MTSLSVSPEQLLSLSEQLLSPSTPLHKRFRALFTLKAVGGPEAIDAISKGFGDESALLKHEFAYVLGQMKDRRAVSKLEEVLSDEKEDPMVRHEAAEALGAIGSSSSLDVLKKYSSDSQDVVRETCEIAIDRINWENSPESKAPSSASAFTSIDPAPPKPTQEEESVEKLKSQLMDSSLPLFKRYRAMFSLRNIGTPEAVDALACGFSDPSALFRHEIAFIYGQLCSAHSIQHLLPVLQNSSEADMVRHEAAEALGSIATPECLLILKEWKDREDSPIVVKQSCEVALDMWEYENSNQFQYADGLSEVKTSGLFDVKA